MSKKILIADDSLTIRKVVELTFLGADCDIVSAATSGEAIERLDDDTDLFILDVHLPDGSGYDLCERVKAERPELPVVLLVGTFEQFDEARMKTCGADRVLRKPFDSQELASLVDELTGSEDAPGEWEAEAEADTVPLSREAEETSVEVEEVVEATSTEASEEAEPTPEVESSVVVVEALPQGEADDEEAAVAETAGPAFEAAATEVTEPETIEVEASTAPSPGGLGDADVERIARRVVELLSDEVIRRVAWEVVPDLAEVVVKERIEELESELSDS